MSQGKPVGRVSPQFIFCFYYYKFILMNYLWSFPPFLNHPTVARGLRLQGREGIFSGNYSGEFQIGISSLSDRCFVAVRNLCREDSMVIVESISYIPRSILKTIYDCPTARNICNYLINDLRF